MEIQNKNRTEQLWNEFHAKLHSFIQSRVGDSAIADDILQEVFIRIHKRIHTLKDDSKIQSWVYQITRNAIIDFYRSRKTMEELPDSLVYEELESEEKTRQDIETFFVPMIQSLPEKYRQAIILSEIQGLTQKKTAEKLGLSLSGGKARVQRGRALLKKRLLDCCNFEIDSRGNVIDYQSKDKNCDMC